MVNKNDDDCEDCCESLPLTKQVQDFFSARQKYQLEWTMFQYMAATFLLLIMVITLLYYAFWQQDNNFLAKRGWWLFYLVVTIVTVIGALWHVRAHKGSVGSMVGMMMGMTLGMQAGVMISVVIGSTNGMFMGGLTGILFGTFVGIYAGQCCGLMGILNGALMGTMGGTMGPMIALMMKNDHILWFMPVFTIINIFILLGLNFLVYENLIGDKNIKKEPADFWTFFSICLILTVLFTLIIVYGYKSAFVA